MVEQVNITVKPESTYPNGFPDREGEPAARESFGEEIRNRMKKKAVNLGSIIKNNPVPYKLRYVDEHGNFSIVEIELYPISKKDRDEIYNKHDSLVIFLQPIFSAELEELPEYFNDLGMVELSQQYKKVRDEIKCAKILKSANIDWADESGKIIWSQGDTQKRDREAAIESINRLLPAGTVDDMVLRIDEISGFMDEKERAALQKK